MHMTRRTFTQLVVLAIAALPLTGCSYNKFVGQEEAIKSQWAQVENQLQRRNDLIPNLVETVKGYAAHEEGVFKEIAEARSRLLGGKITRRDDRRRQPADERARTPAGRSPKTIRSCGPTNSSTG